MVTAASASGGVVHATIKNIGTGGTNESFRVALRQSGSVIDECTVDALDAGESVAATLSPHGACGYLEVYADSGGDVPERDDRNNTKEVWVPCDGGYVPVVPEPEPEPEPDPPDPVPPEPVPPQQVRLPGWGDGGGYLGLYEGFGDGTAEAETTAEAGVEAVVNKTESTGSEQKAKGYPMGTKFNTGGAGGGYFSYIMILAALILLGLLVHGIRKERGRYRRSMK
ncbi:MAG: hypothetical protein C5S52_00245 [ANME-2 cluster archaeon]|nr:hypothetical protein [ANME-2 cluster archaeon]